MTNAIAVHFPKGKGDMSLPSVENPLVAFLQSQKLLV